VEVRDSWTARTAGYAMTKARMMTVGSTIQSINRLGRNR
jgi:hypothetical protein